MIKDKLINIMDFISETNLTEEYFYSNKGKYPVYSGQTSNDGIVALIDSYKETEECVSFTSYGSAGKLSYRKGKYSIGRNALGLKLKEEYKDKIILKWFAYKFQNVFYRRRIGDIAGQKSLNQILLKNLTIAIPSIEIQNQQLALYEKLNSLLYSISDLQSELDNFLNHKFTELDYISHDIIGNIFNIKGGNCGLTEHFIYQNQPTNENENIQITFYNCCAERFGRKNEINY
jgi:restriction endonuclease S subunit